MDFKTETMSLLLLFLSNLWYAITKKSLSSAIPLMKQHIGFTNKNIGECSANFSLLYGSFKLIGGVLADIFPADFLFTLGLALGSLINLCIPIVSQGQYISYFWGLNGLLQGMGGPALSKVVMDHIPADRKAAVWSNLFTVSLLFVVVVFS
jgi:sugar phosphate permease